MITRRSNHSLYTDEDERIPSLHDTVLKGEKPNSPDFTEEKKRERKIKEMKVGGSGKNLQKSNREPQKSDDTKNIQQEVHQETQKKIEEANEKLNILVEKSSRVIFKIKTVFPFDFFPNELSIEDHRLNIIIKNFFASGELKTVSIQDIFEVAVTTDLFFATLRIGARVFSDGVIEINYIRKEEAIKFQQILEGLRVLIQEGVDTTVMESSDLVDKIEAIGRITDRQRI